MHVCGRMPKVGGWSLLAVGSLGVEVCKTVFTNKTFLLSADTIGSFSTGTSHLCSDMTCIHSLSPVVGADDAPVARKDGRLFVSVEVLI